MAHVVVGVWPCLEQHCSIFIFIWQTLPNYNVTRLKRFISWFTDKLYNWFLFSSIFNTPCICRKIWCDKESWKVLGFGWTKQGLCVLISDSSIRWSVRWHGMQRQVKFPYFSKRSFFQFSSDETAGSSSPDTKLLFDLGWWHAGLCKARGWREKTSHFRGPWTNNKILT